MSDLVSIITTIYNSGRFLAESIESVLAQRNFEEWELILIDDGSTDQSALIAQKYAAANSERIRLFAHCDRQNHGISASRNLALTLAHGNLIAFLDADDVWLPEKLVSQIKILRQHPSAAMIYGGAERWFDWQDDAYFKQEFFEYSQFGTTPENILVAPHLPDLGTNILIKPPALLKAFLQDESLTPCTCSVLVRREAVDAVGGFCNDFPGLYEDQVFYAKISLCYPVYIASNCWARYRQHANSCCAAARRDGIVNFARSEFLKWLADYLTNSVNAESERINLLKIVEKETQLLEKSVG